ncbi:fungal hydrophobin-domain-containing protein [Mucidula mucida]|nr:fungal hydrophobin-domain-containing protein [Mucidula mucida]
MYARRAIAFFAYVFFTMTLLAAATPLDARGGQPTVTVTVTAPGTTSTIPAGSCNTGPIQCCNSVQSASSDPVSLLLGLLGIVLSSLNVDVGLTCSPITVIGAGGSSCSAHPVCCQDNSHGGLISIGCIPISL